MLPMYFHDLNQTIEICSNYFNLSLFIFQFALFILNSQYINKSLLKIYTSGIIVSGTNLFICICILFIGHRFVHNLLVLYCVEETVFNFVYIVTICYVLQLSSHVNIANIVLYAVLIAASSQLNLLAELQLVDYKLMLVVSTPIYLWICYELYFGDLSKHWMHIKDKKISEFYAYLRLFFITVYNLNPLLRHMEYFFNLSIPLYYFNAIQLVEKSLFVGCIAYYSFELSFKYQKKIR